MFTLTIKYTNTMYFMDYLVNYTNKIALYAMRNLDSNLTNNVCQDENYQNKRNDSIIMPHIKCLL